MKKILRIVLLSAGIFAGQASACKFTYQCANCVDNDGKAEVIRSVLPELISDQWCQLFPVKDYMLMFLANRYNGEMAVGHVTVWVAKRNSIKLGDYTHSGYAVDADDGSYSNAQLMFKKATVAAVLGLMNALDRIEKKDIR